MNASEQITALVARERHLMARRDHWQAALTKIIARLGEELDAVQTERHRLMDLEFARFDREHRRAA